MSAHALFSSNHVFHRNCYIFCWVELTLVPNHAKARRMWSVFSIGVLLCVMMSISGIWGQKNIMDASATGLDTTELNITIINHTSAYIRNVGLYDARNVTCMMGFRGIIIVGHFD